jgi:hypothetical protein
MQLGYRCKFATAVTAIVLTTIAAVTNAFAATVNVLTFAITITAATAEVTEFFVGIAATAVVAHAQHIVCAKPPNEQT